MSRTETRPASTRDQRLIHCGKWSMGRPTTLFSTSNFTSTASAGAQRYEQHDEEQRPAHRASRLRRRGRGVVARQHMRHRGRAHHQTQHQRDEVDARVVEARLRGRGCRRDRPRQKPGSGVACHPAAAHWPARRHAHARRAPAPAPRCAGVACTRVRHAGCAPAPRSLRAAWPPAAAGGSRRAASPWARHAACLRPRQHAARRRCITSRSAGSAASAFSRCATCCSCWL